MGKEMNRRSFVKTTTAAAAGLAVSSALFCSPGASGAQKTRRLDSNGEYTVRIAGRDYCWKAVLEGGRLAGLTRAQNTSTDLWLTRGLVDIQVNGYAGVEVTSPDTTVDDLARLEQTLFESGTVRWCPTVTSQTPELIRESLARIDEAVSQGALERVQCIHLEANYLSPEDGYRGAHQKQYITPPDIREFESWQKASGGRIGYVSCAPEVEGGIEFIKYLSGKGILAALAHHNASYEKIVEAADAGARLSTHLFNGCAAQMHRHHNVVLSQLSEDRLWASFLPDGHHIPYHVLGVGLRAKGIERAVFTSDLISLGGSPEGDYLIDGQEVLIRDGGAFLKGTPYLYGAWANLSQGIRRATAAGVVTPAEAIRLGSTNPARLLRMEDSLEPGPGAQGPFVMFRETDGELELEGIIA